AHELVSIAHLRSLERHEPLAGARGGLGVGVEPRAPHGRAAGALLGDEQCFPNPQRASPVVIQEHGEPDLEPRALATPKRPVEILRHLLHIHRLPGPRYTCPPFCRAAALTGSVQNMSLTTGAR